MLFQFYKTFLWWNLLITIVAIYAVNLGGPGNVGNSIIIKLIGYLGAWSFQTYFYKYVYFYYRNAGQSVKKLYSYTFSIDFVTYLLLTGSYIIYIHYPHVKG
ncbi:hypothetical protein RG47T_2220 [Mucilaginibacter polytrichastri]|uniref:Uncharacterized protein n=1 Tax=Mucilaginibacter polytrichastri TaxID=1302689 RepID=A0A1Q5ZYC4_9SPHI|nr:hypothetical protein RG47T_2220 [Mucilaginibacter polytrichastri]